MSQHWPGLCPAPVCASGLRGWQGGKGTWEQALKEGPRCGKSKDVFLPGNPPAPHSAPKTPFRKKYLKTYWERHESGRHQRKVAAGRADATEQAGGRRGWRQFPPESDLGQPGDHSGPHQSPDT